MVFKRTRLERSAIKDVLGTAQWNVGTDTYLVPGEAIQNLQYAQEGKEPPNDLVAVRNWPHRMGRPAPGTDAWWKRVERALQDASRRKPNHGLRVWLGMAYAELVRDIRWQGEKDKRSCRACQRSREAEGRNAA